MLLPKPWGHLCSPALCNRKHTGPPSIWATERVNVGDYGRGLSVYCYSKHNAFQRCPEGLRCARQYRTVSEQPPKKAVGRPFLWGRCSQPSLNDQMTMIRTISSTTKGLMKAEPHLFFIMCHQCREQCLARWKLSKSVCRTNEPFAWHAMEMPLLSGNSISNMSIP